MMRLLTILVLFSVGVQGQYTKNVRTMGSGIKVGFGVHNPGPNTNGKPLLTVIFLHGIDHCLPNNGSQFDTTTIYGIQHVTLKNIPAQVLTKALPVRRVPGTVGAAGLEKTAVIFPQCRYGQIWPAEYVIEMIEYIKERPTIYDTNRIILTGYSLGGFGVNIAIANQYCRDNIAGFFAVAPGGYLSGFPYAAVAASGVWYETFHNIGDKLAPISVSDNLVAGLNAQRPVVPVQYERLNYQAPIFNSNSHDYNNAYYDTTAGNDSWNLTNGNTWTNYESFYQRIFRLNKQHPHR